VSDSSCVCSVGSPPACKYSVYHQSVVHGAGARSWLFSRNSPWVMRISPRSRISSIWSRRFSARFSVWIRVTSPLYSLTSGPSMVVTGTAP